MAAAPPGRLGRRTRGVTTSVWQVHADAPARYDVRIADSLLDPRNTELLRGGRVPGRRFIIADGGVPEDVLTAVDRHLVMHGVRTRMTVLPGGEPCKTMDTAMRLLSEIEDFAVERREEPILVIGGGAVLDVGGFAASMYRRGVPYVRVPTTLLAYIDASIGVKTGINFMERKNLVGAFFAPSCVLLDRSLLGSLPNDEVTNGFGEVLKLAVACDEFLFEMVEEHARYIDAAWLQTADGGEVLDRSISTMLREIGDDLFERHLRRSVDIGHTFSQAFELRLESAGMRHGEAVALDVNLCAAIATQRSLMAPQDFVRVCSLTRRLGLPITAPRVSTATLWDSVEDRTCHRGGRQSIPLPTTIGSCVFIDDLSLEELGGALDLLAGVTVP